MTTNNPNPSQFWFIVTKSTKQKYTLEHQNRKSTGKCASELVFLRETFSHLKVVPVPTSKLASPPSECVDECVVVVAEWPELMEMVEE